MLKEPLCSLEASNVLSIETTIRRDIKICGRCNEVKLKYRKRSLFAYWQKIPWNLIEPNHRMFAYSLPTRDYLAIRLNAFSLTKFAKKIASR